MPDTTKNRAIDTSPAAPPASQAPTAPAGSETALSPSGSDRWVAPSVICFHEPWNETTDYYRQFRAALTTSAAGPQKVLMFASALPGEGRSTVLVNFAVVTCRDLAAKIALVDCDLRQPSTHELFRLPAEPGLSELLAGRSSLQQCLRQTPIEGLTLLPAGQPSINPAEMLNSAKMDAVLDELRRTYDYVLLDAPAILPAIDASRLAPKADGIILVVQAWQTPRARIQRAIEMLGRANLLGFLLNRAEPSIRL